MRKKLKLLLVAATLALTIGIISLGGGVVSAPAKAAGNGTLEGFTSSGASVYIATDGTDVRQMRFQIDLTADKAAYAGAGKTAGVVYMPLDVYKVNGVTELTKDTPSAITADVTKNWTANADGSYSSYAYLDSRFIPAGQENRTLVARGYIVDGENVYYTDEVKASMAYVAWKNLDMEEGKYADQLKKYMGPYTLTYGDDGKIENLYYGDTFTLPTSIGTDTVDKWYWDLACTQEIKPTDYATGSMKIYYELRKVEVSGTIACAASSVDLTKTEIYANGKKIDATINASGNYTVNVSIKNAYDLVFKNDNYVAYGNVTVGEDAVADVNATLKPNTFDIGNFGSVRTNIEVDTAFRNNVLDGNVTLAGMTQTLIFPNTASEEEFEYSVNVSNVDRNGASDRGYGISLTDGNYNLAVSIYENTNGIIVTLGGIDSFYIGNGGVSYGGTVSFVVRENEIKFNSNGTTIFTFTKDGYTHPDNVLWGLDSLTQERYKAMISGFFAEDRKLACGIYNGFNGAVKATYSCKINMIGTVTGTVSAPSGSTDFDLSTVKVYADGNLTDTVVAADGTFSLAIPEGTHNFSFETEGYIAYADGVTVGKDAAPITATLVDNTNATGNYGSIKSSTDGYDRSDALDGTIAVSGHNKLLIMPNIAADKTYFVYEVQVSSGVSRTTDDATYGIALTDGKKVLSIGFQRWGRITVNLASGSGAENAATYFKDMSCIGGDTLKFVVSGNKIEFYYNNALFITFTADGITRADSVSDISGMFGAPADSLSSKYAELIEGFFADNAKLACGISNGLNNGSSTATYAYSTIDMQTVTGTVSAPSGSTDFDLTKVKVYANGNLTDTVVAANGTFSLILPEGSHDFSFETEGYIAYADGITVGKNTAPINVTLLDGTYAIGNYGNVKSSTDGYDKLDALDGTLTVSGSNKLLVMPNTATSDPFVFSATVSDVSRGGTDMTYGIALSDGKYNLMVGLYQWMTVLNISSGSGVDRVIYLTSVNGPNGNVNGTTMKFVVSDGKIEFYNNENMLLSFNKDGFTMHGISKQGWSGDGITDNYASYMNGFFADNAKLVCGISNGLNGSVTATYTYSANKLYTVSGTLAPAAGVDLTATTLTIDGAATPITVGSDGKYTLLVPEGERKFVFSNGNLGATVVKTIINGENVVDVTSWTDYTWAVGNYGTVKSTQTPDLNQSGVYTVSGQNQLLVMPNTATSEAFTFSAQTSDVSRPEGDDCSYGISLTDGTTVLTVGFYQWALVININTGAGSGNIVHYGLAVSNVDNVTMKFVVSSGKIEFYRNDELYVTFNPDGFTVKDGLSIIGWSSDQITPNYSSLSGLFADNAKLACGINNGLNKTVTATYTCSITKN